MRWGMKFNATDFGTFLGCYVMENIRKIEEISKEMYGQTIDTFMKEETL